jgi:hypothetical protein
VWKREPKLIELPISDGGNLLDDNILACSDAHIKAVFAMMMNNKPCEFTGGLEAKLLKPWHCFYLANLKPKQIFFAYDTPDDLEPLVEAGKLLRKHGIKSNALRCHVLMGWFGLKSMPDDTMDAAEKRMWQTVDAGFITSAMLYCNAEGKRLSGWNKFQGSWQRPARIKAKIKQRRSATCEPCQRGKK